jgi:hypothetical protein
MRRRRGSTPRREVARVTVPRNPARPDQDGDADEEGRALLVGPPVEALRGGLAQADIKKGPIFGRSTDGKPRRIRRSRRSRSNLIVKRGCAMSGLELEAFSAQGPRAEYLTEAARQGIGLPEAMQQFQHRSVQQAASYYTEAECAQRAARIYDAANGMSARAVLSADNIVPARNVVSRQHGGFQVVQLARSHWR